MGNERDVFEWRRYGHWSSSAQKARFAAFALWRLHDKSRLDEAIRECDYPSGDASLAVTEAFDRESAVAMELIIKAVIANRLIAARANPVQAGVPATHDIPTLWVEAGLPALGREDQYRLLLFKSKLTWSGRYPTPRTVKAWEDESREFDKLEDPPAEPGKIAFRKPITTGWREFDRLYQIAARQVWPRARPTSKP